MWSLLYEYLRLRQEKLSSSAEADFWSNVDLPSITLTSRGFSSSSSLSSSPRRQQRHTNNNHQIQRHHGNGAENDNNTQSTMPMLYSLARQWAFQAVAFRCQTNPEETSSVWIDDQGDNVLHWVVFGNPPLNVVKELLRACPDLARKPNKKRTLPLHGTIFLSYLMKCARK
jgi:hypothetical protein